MCFLKINYTVLQHYQSCGNCGWKKFYSQPKNGNHESSFFIVFMIFYYNQHVFVIGLGNSIFLWESENFKMLEIVCVFYKFDITLKYMWMEYGFGVLLKWEPESSCNLYL